MKDIRIEVSGGVAELVGDLPKGIRLTIFDHDNNEAGENYQPQVYEQPGEEQPEHVQKYLANGGVTCPYCGSPQLDGQSFDTDCGACSQEVRCLDCGSVWLDQYDLIDIFEYGEGEPTP